MLNSKGQNAALRARLLTCGATAAILTACAFAAPVMAQDTTAAAPADDTTTIVVTGIRRGIQDAISAKKKSAEIVEAVSAEDIGKLPDASIAESMARLPGIAAQRINGRAQLLSIRGLGPDYTVTTLNGREQASTNDNRSVEFDQYPSELISQVVVYKTPNASMTAQGIAGTADLQTVRPLAYGKRAGAINFRRDENSKDPLVGGTENTGNRYSISYIDQFADKTIGIALGYAHTSTPTQDERWEAWDYGDFNGASALNGSKPSVISSLLERDGYMGVLEWKPNDRLHMVIDAYHSDFTETLHQQRIEFPLYNPSGQKVCSDAEVAADPDNLNGCRGWDGSTYLNAATVSDGMVTEATYKGVKAVLGNYVSTRKAKVDAIGWNTAFALNENWDLTADLSHSKVDRLDKLVETTAGTGPNGTGTLDTISYTNNGDPTGITFTNTIDYSDFNNIVLTDARGWGDSHVSGIGGQAGYVHTPHVIDELNSVRLAAKRRFDGGPFSDLSFGYNHSERSKSKDGNEGWLSIATGAYSSPVPEAYRTGVTSLAFIGITKGIASYDAMGLYNSGFYRYTENENSTINRSWRVEEKIDTLYVQANIDSTFLGVPMTGNIGVQAQHADQKSTAFFPYTDEDGGTAGTTYVDGANYTDVLPSLNLSFDVATDLKVRVAAAQTIARPRMDDLTIGDNGTSYTTTALPNAQGYYYSSNSGNAQLKPWKANAYDLSIEKYFGRKGYVAGAVFYKELTSYIYTQSVLKDFTGLPDNGGHVPDGVSRLGLASTKANGEGGHISGVELTLSLPGEIVWAPLDGFGLIVSGAFNDSAIRPTGTTADIDLPGLSKETINTTLYFEKYGFSARISNRYRGDFLGEVPDFQNALTRRSVKSESIYDAQMSYEFKDGPLQGVSLLLQASNLTDVPFYTYQGDNSDQVLQYDSYGRTVTFGINYRF